MERSHQPSGRSATPADINRNGRPTSIGTGGRHQSECPADIIGIRTSGRRSAIDQRTTRHPGYAKSQRIRKRIEEAFGWIKTVAGLRQTKLRGRAKVAWAFTFAVAAYNLVRAPALLAAAR
jgi:hypothetical protein